MGPIKRVNKLFNKYLIKCIPYCHPYDSTLTIIWNMVVRHSKIPPQIIVIEIDHVNQSVPIARPKHNWIQQKKAFFRFLHSPS